MRSEGTVVGSVCVCLSVTLNLTSRVFVRLTKDMTYLTLLARRAYIYAFTRISLPRGRHIYVHAMSGAQALDIPVCFS